MTVPFVDLHTQYLTIKENIDNAIKQVISESAFIRGRFVDVFENEFSEAMGIKHCVSCANGTDALYIVMKGLDLQSSDEVITTAHSWISTSETITQAGGRVIFCDTDPDTFTIDPLKIEEKITKKTVGIIPVHLYGQSADMDPIIAIAKKHNLWIIEDCSQAHLAEYKGKKVGTMGNAGTFSFYPGKNLGAMGDAGSIITNDNKLAEFCQLFARHGGKGNHIIEGINSRMDGLQAAILSAKLPHLKSWTLARAKHAQYYSELLSQNKNIILPKVSNWNSHVYHLFVIKAINRDNLQKYLSSVGIATIVNYPKALPFYPAYNYLNHSIDDFPNAFDNQKKILSIPMYPELTLESIEYISININKFYNC